MKIECIEFKEFCCKREIRGRVVVVGKRMVKRRECFVCFRVLFFLSWEEFENV